MKQALSMAAGLASISMVAASPLAFDPIDLIQRRQDDTGNVSDPTTWCATFDATNEETVGKIWNDWGVGYWMDLMLAKSYSPPNEDWMYKMFAAAYPQAGDPKLDGCGTIDGTCNMDLDCTDMVERHYGMNYFVLTAAQKMHDQITALHETFQDAIIDTQLSIPGIIDDFATVAESADPGAWLGTASYLVGSVAGMGSVLTGFNPAIQAAFGWASASTYLIGGIGNAITKAQGTPATVEGDTLTEALHTIFSMVRQQLEDILVLATGGPGDYASLPAQGMIEGRNADSPIAAFFSDGRWLLGDGVYVAAATETFSWIKKRIVDLSVAGAGHMVLSDVDITSEEDCVDQYGAQWMADIEGGICMRLFTPHEQEQKCSGHGNAGTGALCFLTGAANDVYDKLQEKYGIDMIEYYRAAYDCAKNGDGSASDDMDILRSGPDIPTCFYSVPCKKVEFRNNLSKEHTTYSDF